jgi:hypothetical protein
MIQGREVTVVVDTTEEDEAVDFGLPQPLSHQVWLMGKRSGVSAVVLLRSRLRHHFPHPPSHINQGRVAGGTPKLGAKFQQVAVEHVSAGMADSCGAHNVA